jgi:hypothetical protein
MPDKPYHIDNSLADRGWSEMAKLLDREMPVPPVPFYLRFKGLLWLLLLLIPLGAAWGYYHFKPAPQEPAPVNNAAKTPPVVAYAGTEAEKEDCPDIAAPLANPAKALALARIQAPSEAPKQSQEAVAVPVAERQASVSFAAAPGLDFLETSLRPIQRSHTLATAAAELLQPSIAIAPRRPVRFGVEAGAFASSGFRSAGFSAGLLAAYSFDEKWGVQAGLGYAHFSQPFPARSLSQNARLSDFSESGSFGNNATIDQSAVESLAKSADSTVSNLQFIDLSLSATYQAAKNWRLHAGGGAAFGISGNATAADAEFTPVSSIDPGYFAQTPRMYPFLEAGLTWMPRPRLGVSAQGQLGLRDMLPQWPDVQRLHRVGVKLGYWF